MTSDNFPRHTFLAIIDTGPRFIFFPLSVLYFFLSNFIQTVARFLVSRQTNAAFSISLLFLFGRNNNYTILINRFYRIWSTNAIRRCCQTELVYSIFELIFLLLCDFFVSYFSFFVHAQMRRGTHWTWTRWPTIDQARTISCIHASQKCVFIPLRYTRYTLYPIQILYVGLLTFSCGKISVRCCCCCYILFSISAHIKALVISS